MMKYIHLPGSLLNVSDCQEPHQPLSMIRPLWQDHVQSSRYQHLSILSPRHLLQMRW